jgi:hypothetical protein
MATFLSRYKLPLDCIDHVSSMLTGYDGPIVEQFKQRREFELCKRDRKRRFNFVLNDMLRCIINKFTRKIFVFSDYYYKILYIIKDIIDSVFGFRAMTPKRAEAAFHELQQYLRQFRTCAYFKEIYAAEVLETCVATWLKMYDIKLSPIFY